MSRSSEIKGSSKSSKVSTSSKQSSRPHGTVVKYNGVPGAVISEIIPGKLFMSNLEGTSDLRYLQVLCFLIYHFFYLFILKTSF